MNGISAQLRPCRALSKILSRSMNNNINGSQSLERLKLVKAKKAVRKLEVGIIKGRCTGDTDIVMGASRRMENDMTESGRMTSLMV